MDNAGWLVLIIVLIEIFALVLRRRARVHDMGGITMSALLEITLCGVAGYMMGGLRWALFAAMAGSLVALAALLVRLRDPSLSAAEEWRPID